MAVTETVTSTDLEFARQLGQQLRVDSIRCSTAAGSGHPTSSMSAADLIAVLIARYLQYDWSKPKDPNNDHLIYSKGHASPLCYAMFKAVGAITDAELMTFRRFGSRLQGHPTPVIPWVDVATGSLGQGLPIGVGVALAGQYLDKLPYHVWVLCGDSELAEGSIWEAIDKAAHYQLANLTAIWDINRLGQRGETEYGWSLDTYRRRVEAFGCHPIVIDGHDLASIDRAFGEALSNTGKPTVIIAKTVKGKGFSEIENKDGWHGRALPPDMAERAIKELGGIRNLKVKTQKPERSAAPKKPAAAVEPVMPTYKKEDKVATRKAYGDALVAEHVDHLEELLHDGRREALRHLIEHQEARLRQDRASHRDHLLLTTGQRPHSLAAALLEARKDVISSLDVSLRTRRIQRQPERVLNAQAREKSASFWDVREAHASDRFWTRTGDVAAGEPYASRPSVDHA